MRDDEPLRVGTRDVDEPVAPVAQSKTLAVRMQETVVLEGAMVAPSSIDLEVTTEAPFAARLRASPARRKRRGILATLIVLAWGCALASVFSGATPEALCSGVSLTIMTCIVPLAALAWAMRSQDLRLDEALFATQTTPKGVMGWRRIESAHIFGFGYQRHPRWRWKWQLVVVLRSGFTIPIDVAVAEKGAVRFIARRLNAALAAVQRVDRSHR
ncbi:MAG: hypothetical protein JNK05_29810 [Myxococcales bacterium]|nr:hypothetical protein [Myxococcales bacterium]